MASSSPVHDDASGALRRASGRVRKQPDLYAASPFVANKRKRSNEEQDDDDVEMAEEDMSEEDAPSSDDEPDVEELRERKRAARKAKSVAQNGPVSKKPKMNGTSLPIRSVNGGPKKKPAKRAKAKGVASKEAAEAGTLYAEVFVDGTHFEEIIARWLHAFAQHHPQALAELINFILRCAGCDVKVTDSEAADIDHCAKRLTEVQDEHQASSPTDYPLIAKGKAGTNFKDTLHDFLETLIKSIAANGELYSTPKLIENIKTWFSTMSSASDRAFRHTATFASLTVISTLCELEADLAKETASSQLQADSERKKQKINKARVKQIEAKVKETTKSRVFIDGHVKDWFDTVFVHRYRDVDPAIRRDCAMALGDWIMTLPDGFFDGHHLRYLGWTLSDTAAPTRIEVIKQLQRMYKDQAKIGGLRTFTERFRGRLVEIATTDAETNVRAAGIELLNVLRENGLLEPDDVDAVGRLVYDSDPRVRKAVTGFFSEIIQDLANARTDELGGLESLEEVLPEFGEGNFTSPRVEWLKYKSLAEMMVNYDTEESLPPQTERRRGDGGLTLHANGKDSRFTLAAEVLYDNIDEIKDWQALSGYLLFDHSAGRTNGVANDSLSLLKHECVLVEKEEVVLLDILGASVKRALIDLSEKNNSTKSKLTKKQKEVLLEEQEEAARHLAAVIPKLLKKFGDVPSTASAVLRMESVLNLPSLQDLQQDSTTHGALLDDIRKQFMSHGTDEVLGPASEAILHAKSYGELDDLTEEKLGGLWEDVVSNLSDLLNPKTITVRGASSPEELVGLSNNLLRITRLAQVSNCIPPLEDSTIAASGDTNSGEYQGAVDYIIALIHRAVPADGPAIDPEEATLEDEVAVRAAEAALRYLQWKITSIIQAANATADISYDELEALATRRDSFVTNIERALRARKAKDAICSDLTGYILDLFISAVVLRTIKIRPGMQSDWDVLIMNLNADLAKTVMKVFSAAEQNFATLSGKKLQLGPATEADDDVDGDPIDDDPLSDSEFEDEEDEPTQTQASQMRKETKQRSTILAERKLCELTRSLIFAVHAGVVDIAKTRERLERNKASLGPNFKEILAYLDLDKKMSAASKSRAKAKGKGTTKGVAAKSKSTSNPKSNAIVAEDDMDDDIEDADEEEELTRRELTAEQEGGAQEEEEAEGEAESVLGD